MPDTLFGLGMMVVAAVGLGIGIGFTYEENAEGERKPDPAYALPLFLYYIGALMFAPAALEKVPSYFGYATATIIAGLLVATLSAYLATLAFRAGSRLFYGPRPEKPKTGVPGE